MHIRVAIVEDDPGVRQTLKAIIQRAPNLTADGAYGSAEEALQPLLVSRPDVVLVDIRLPGKNGITLVAELKAKLPSLRVMMITVYEESDEIFAALQAGASGYLLKRAKAQEIVRSIEELYAGGAPMSAEVARKVVAYFQQLPQDRGELAQLTSRELEILMELSKGYRYQKIAERLFVGVETVRTHVHHIYEKLHVDCRAQAVHKFMRARPVSSDSRIMGLAGGCIETRDAKGATAWNSHL